MIMWMESRMLSVLSNVGPAESICSFIATGWNRSLFALGAWGLGGGPRTGGVGGNWSYSGNLGKLAEEEEAVCPLARISPEISNLIVLLKWKEIPSVNLGGVSMYQDRAGIGTNL